MKQHIHAVRLRGPWQYQITSAQMPAERCDLSKDSQQPPLEGKMSEGKITLPADVRKLCSPNQSASIKLTRRFHCPTGLTASDQLWLTFENCKTTATVVLNDQRVGQLQPGKMINEIYLSEPLRLTNLLSLEFQIDKMIEHSVGKITVKQSEENDQFYPVSEVRLEIRS